MKSKVIAYEIVNHGYEHAQYFQGCGTFGTTFNNVYTGCGNDAKEAYEQAAEQVYMSYDVVSLPKRPRGINKKDRVPAYLTKDEESEIYWYVSIRVKTI